MHRDVALPLVADRIRLTIDLEAPLVCLKPAVPELAEERQEPLVPCQRRPLVGGRHFPRSLPESLPVAHADVPGPGGRLVQSLAGVEVVRIGRQPRQARVAIDDACQQVHRQQQARCLDGREGVSHASSHVVSSSPHTGPAGMVTVALPGLRRGFVVASSVVPGLTPFAVTLLASRPEGAATCQPRATSWELDRVERMAPP
jgi:hypothetical protein